MAGPIKVSIAADASGMRAGIQSANAQLNSLNKQAAQSTAAVGKLDRGFAAMSKGLAAVAGATAAVGLLKGLVGAAEAASTANARLEQVFQSMGDATGQAALAAQEYATELSRTTGIEANTVKAAQAKLATFKAVSDESARQAGIFDRATQAAADLAATGFGDMTSTSVQLGKALQDPIAGITALTRSGVTFTDSQKDMIKTLVEGGNTLEAQNIILAAVEEQVGGVAESTANATDIMAVRFEEIKVSLGTALLPVVEALASGMGTLADVFAKIPTPVVTATIAIAGLVVAKKLLAAVLARTAASLALYEARLQKSTGGTSLLGVAAGTASTNVGKMAKGLGIAAAAMAVLGAAGSSAASAMGRIVPATKDLQQGMDGVTVSTDEFTTGWRGRVQLARRVSSPLCR